MAILSLRQRKDGTVTGFIVTTMDLTEELRLKEAGGSSNSSGKWYFPLDTDLEALSGIDLAVDSAAQEWLDVQEKRYCHLVGLHKVQYAMVKYPERLDPYQQVGVRFLADAQRAVLADDVGLGKTIQAIRAAVEVKAQKVLVVTKKSLVWNWKEAVLDWWPDDYVDLSIMTSASKDIPSTTVVITNYEAVTPRAKEIAEHGFDALIVDEAAYVKNPKAKRTKAIFEVAGKIPYVWLLTATPTPNGIWELWSLLHILDPVKYSSYWRFVDRYCYTEPNFFGGRDLLPGVRNRDMLQRELAPVVLRRTKELLNLPPVSHEKIMVDLLPEQKRVYREMKKDFVTAVSGERVVFAPTIVAQLTRLRQIGCSPALLGGVDKSAKTEALLDLLEEYAPQHKILVFSTFSQYVDLLLPKLEQYGAVAITGGKSTKARKEAEESFKNDPTCRVLLGTIGAMGEGLNLQAADIVIFTDKNWVPSDNDLQAVGRAHRRGQTKPVHVITLVGCGTVDEYIERVLSTKMKVSEALEWIVKRLKGEAV